jgi:predicted Zn-dependent protease
MQASTPAPSQEPELDPSFDLMAFLADSVQGLHQEPDLPQDVIEYAYSCGYHWLEVGDFARAQTAFKYLWLRRPDEARFAAGMGQVAVGLNDSTSAMSWYLLALSLDDRNAAYALNLAQAFIDSELPLHAFNALRVSIALAETSGDTQIADKAQGLITLLTSTP